MSDPVARPTTPSTSPKYGIHLSESMIRSIVAHSLPNIPSDYKISTLRSDQSLFNRIYFITPPLGGGGSYVLKVSGRVPGKTRIENEVASLLLLQHFCPDVPAPRPVAWSAVSGAHISRYVEASGKGMFGVISTDLEKVDNDERDIRPWLLMTRLEGKELDVSTLTTEQASAVADQLATMVSSWRRNIPKSFCAGNINFAPSTAEPSNVKHSETALNIPSNPFYVHGLLGPGTGFEPPMPSLLDYWKTTLACETSKLQTKPKLMGSQNSQVIPTLITGFITNTLPHLSLFKQPTANIFTFTHTDFAPRNVLVSESDHSIVTGIIDFEFAGFFPAPQEFYAEILNLPRPKGIGLGAEGDWPREMYFDFLRKLEHRDRLEGEEQLSLLQGWKEKTRVWKELGLLRRVEVFIAPPLIVNDEVEIGRLLEFSKTEVEQALADLWKMVLNAPLDS